MAAEAPIFHPLIAEWFAGRFVAPTDAQSRAWPEIRAGRDVLISAPTGSGKTLAAFLICLDRLVARAEAGALTDDIDVLYVSPLRALSNDIRKNLEAPLAELHSLAGERGRLLPPIRTAVRTGDTPQWERQQMVRKPPHILVTTPESLFILLTADRSRQALRSVSTVIVDEIHALVDDKRGSHLALSLARLDDLVEKSGHPTPQRIGLSATVRPLDEVAGFLASNRSIGSPDGNGNGHHAGVTIVDSGHRRALDIAVEVPRDELGAVATHEMWQELYERIAELIRSHRTTLVFVNTRRLAERVTHHLAERLGEDAVLAHHGSLAPHLRLKAETRLKRGELRAVVATASLELGIDIGSVDLVCQIGSPRSIAVTLQRIGRSGHHVDRPGEKFVPKGRLFATTRDELIECAALVRSIRSGELDRLELPVWPRDVLAQQIVAASAADSWREDELFALVRRAHPYRDLPRAEFDALIEMLTEGIATGRGRRGAYLHRDQVNGVVRGRRSARLTAITSGGAIPEIAAYPVVAEPDNTVVGTLDEDFAVESLAGDVFLLGSNSWRVRRVEAGRVRVEDAHGAAPSVPFWRGEAPGRTTELSREISRVKERVAELLDSAGASAAEDFLQQEGGLDGAGATQVVAYVRDGCSALGVLPRHDCVVAERFFDEGGGMQLVLHSPYGARINRAWGLALRKRFCRTFNFELQAAATDNGIVISLSDRHSFPLEVIFRFLNVNTVEDVLTQAMLDAPMFTARWRWNASRALAILRFSGGRKVPPQIQRMRSDDLLASVFPDQVACAENLVGDIRIPDHPLVNETIRDCLQEAMDLEGLKALLGAIADGSVTTHSIDTAQPSPFSHEILNANPYAYLDDAPLEERRTRAVQMRRTLGGETGVMGALNPEAIAEVTAQAWPVVRDADELHDALLSLVVVPPVAEWQEHFATLGSAKRAAVLHAGDRMLWVAAERLGTARLLYPDAVLVPEIRAVETRDVDGREAAADTVRGWLEAIGPTTARDLAGRLALPEELVNGALAALESEGLILRGHFTPASVAARETEWCDRRLLARIHRLTIGQLRREIEPVTAATFMDFLFRWQHLAPGTLLHGQAGILEIIRQLQGYEISAAAWEPDVLRSRIARYSPELLDRLCFSGDVIWGRLSHHPAFDAEPPASAPARPGRSTRRFRPTRVAPITIFLREDAPWLVATAAALGGAGASEGAGLSPRAGKVLDVLRTRGASFVAEMARAARESPRDVEDALWELAAAGLVTADAFDNLRALIDPARRARDRRWRNGRGRQLAGRWALLRSATLEAAEAPSGSADAHLEAFARQLLLRWGVIFRDVIARETLAPPWRELLRALRRMEARGEIRGGRFVSGFMGEQFARAEAVDLLRSVRRGEPLPRPLRVSAADPLNLAGIITPGPRVSALIATTVQVVAAPEPEYAAQP